jgi:hypothetical protein
MMTLDVLTVCNTVHEVVYVLVSIIKPIT